MSKTFLLKFPVMCLSRTNVQRGKQRIKKKFTGGRFKTIYVSEIRILLSKHGIDFYANILTGKFALLSTLSSK